MKRLISIIMVMALVMSLAACKSDDSDNGKKSGDVYKLKIAHHTPEGSPYDKAALLFKELVEERTDGKVNITVYPGGVLGDERSLTESIQNGTLDLAVLTISPMVNFVPDLAVLDLPYVFTNFDQAKKFLDSDISMDLLNAGIEDNFKGLGLILRGPRHITNNKGPINTPADVKGMKIRVVESPVYLKVFGELGATVQAMSWGDCYTALQQGAIDGQENATHTIYDERVDEVQKYVSLTNHAYCWTSIFASKSNLEQLPEDIQQIIVDAGNEATREISNQQMENEQFYVDELTKRGMTFNEVDEKLFMDKIDPVYKWYRSNYNDKWLDDINELIK